MRIKELQQQWESAESPGELSQQLLGKLRQQLSDGLALERSISHSARMVIAIAKYPRLADRATMVSLSSDGLSAAATDMFWLRSVYSGYVTALYFALGALCKASCYPMPSELGCR